MRYTGAGANKRLMCCLLSFFPSRSNEREGTNAAGGDDGRLDEEHVCSVCAQLDEARALASCGLCGACTSSATCCWRPVAATADDFVCQACAAAAARATAMAAEASQEPAGRGAEDVRAVRARWERRPFVATAEGAWVTVPAAALSQGSLSCRRRPQPQRAAQRHGLWWRTACPARARAPSMRCRSSASRPLLPPQPRARASRASPPPVPAAEVGRRRRGQQWALCAVPARRTLHTAVPPRRPLQHPQRRPSRSPGAPGAPALPLPPRTLPAPRRRRRPRRRGVGGVGGAGASGGGGDG